MTKTQYALAAAGFIAVSAALVHDTSETAREPGLAQGRADIAAERERSRQIALERYGELWERGDRARAAEAKAPAPQLAERAPYDARRVGRLLRSPVRNWTDSDVEYVKGIGGLPAAGLNPRVLELYAKWHEHDSGMVTHEEQQVIAERIAAELPEEFAIHMTGVQGRGNGLTITLNLAVQDVWWSVDCGVKRYMLDGFVETWRTVLHAAQDAKGTERTAVDVTVRTSRGELAHWNALTGAAIQPLPRCRSFGGL
jgi:hypothetical protein